MRRLLPNRRPAARGFVVAIILFLSMALLAAAIRSTPVSLEASTVADVVAGAVVVSAHSCATGWQAGTAGRHVFRIDNRTGRRATLYLFNPYFGVTVAQATVPPHGGSTLSVRLKAGRYQWGCHVTGQPARTSAVAAVRPAPVSGGAAGPLYVTPVTTLQMAPAVAAYRAYVTGELALDAVQVRDLASAIAGGQMAPARAAWLTAHLTWHRIGGAYDAFGDLGTSIDGTAYRLQDGVTSPQFTGFHKVELDLWGDDNLTVAAADTATLSADLQALATQFPHDAIAATELPLRTHEILEDALRDELSGEDDYGSGTDMASVAADVDGTRELLTLLAPLLAPRAPDLETTVTAQLDTLDAALAATQDDGQWVAVTAVPLAQRQRVDGAIGAALECLDLTPELLQVTGATT